LTGSRHDEIFKELKERERERKNRWGLGRFSKQVLKHLLNIDFVSKEFSKFANIKVLVLV
jgi:hypothetical protein